MRNNSQRSAGRPWKKGESGNLKGRPKNPLKALIQSKTHNGEELVDKALFLMRNSREDKVVLSAIEWLADRGYDRVPQGVMPVDGDGQPLTIKLVNFSEQ